MTTKSFLGLALLGVWGGCNLLWADNITVHTIGDSTMANYDESTTDKRGWGMMFQQFFYDGVTVNNRGKSGASSKSFYEEAAYWTTVRKQIKTGDYVLIQFSHNDEKTAGTDGDSLKAYYTALGDAAAAAAVDYRGTTAYNTYKNYLRKYVNETRELGATPILVGPMCRKYFSGEKITRTGRHDLGDKFNKIENGTLLEAQKVPADDHTYDYPYQMQQVAQELDVPYIDLTTLTKEALEQYGSTACTQLLFCKDDNTHPNAMGGTLVARLCAKELAKQHILADYINTSSDLTVNPTTADLGKAYTGQTLSKEFSLSGFDLTPASGTITITASEGFLVGKSKGEAGSRSIAYSYTGGNVDFTRFYVTCQLQQEGTLQGTITITNGSSEKTATVSASCIELTGGTQALAYWRLESSDECTLEGPATIIAESHSDMYVQKYSAPNANTIWPENTGFTASRKTQRNLIVGDAWPAGEIDEVSTRYIQFGLQANEGTTLNIDSIGLYVCGCGGNGMRCRISYSTDADFANPVAIQEFQSMPANNMMAVEATPVIELQPSQALYLRVYPWYSSAATGKTICLSDVTIRGVAKTLTGISQHKSCNEVVNHSYISLQGIRSEQPSQGMQLVETRFADGQVQVQKVCY